MLPASQRDRRVTIQRFTATQDEYGEEIETWADQGTRWTAIFYGKGDERRQAAVEMGKQSASFVMLADSLTRSVSIKDRLVADGDAWDLVSVSPLGRAEIEFVGVRAS